MSDACEVYGGARGMLQGSRESDGVGLEVGGSWWWWWRTFRSKANNHVML